MVGAYPMSVRTDVINLNINVNANVAQNQLNELRKKAADVRFQMDGLKKGTQEYLDKKAQLAEYNSQMAELKKTIGLTALSQKELVAELNKLKALKGSTVPFSKEYEEFDKQIKKVENRLYDVRNGVQGFSSFMSKIKDEVKQFGLLAAGYLGFQFLGSQFKNIITGSGKLSDQLADLRRVAGFTNEEAENLNKGLSKIDTRTAVSQLRDIAIVAGKLGVAKEDILGFTKAVDQLVVALGDELGDADAITSTLGKILSVFDGKIDGDNITKLGNSIVELANTGSASGAFIADFDQRLSGIAKSSGISLGALSGLGAGLEEMGARVESSSTAIQKLIVSISENIPAATKIANLSIEDFAKLGVKSFDELFKKDPTEALLRYSQGLVKNKTSFSEVTASLKDAGEEGARTIEVITKLGGSADYLRGRIDLGKESIKESSAITEAFALKNETFGASLEKLGKDFNSYVSGSGITAFLKSATDGVIRFIAFLKDLPNWLRENRTALLAVITVLFAYIAAKTKATQASLLNRLATLLETAADKLEAAQKVISTAVTKAYAFAKAVLTREITLATAAQRVFNLVLKANPLVLIISLVGALATAISFLAKKTTELSASEKVRQDLQRQTVESTANEIATMRSLINVVGDSNISLESRKKALKDLIAINPEYLKGLTLENIRSQEGVNIINNYVKALRQKAAIQAGTEAQAEKIKEDMKLQQQQFELEKKIANGKKELNDLSADEQELVGTARKQFAFSASVTDLFTGSSAADEALNEIKSKRAKIQVELDIIDGFIAENYTKTIDAVSAKDNTVKDVIDKSVAARIKFLQEKIDGLKAAYQTLDAVDTKGQATNLAEQKKYQDELDRLEGKQNKSAEKAFKKTESEIQRLRKEWQALSHDINDAFALMKDDPFAQGISKANKEAEEQQAKVELFLKKKIITQQQYADSSVRIEEIRLKKIKDLVEKYAVRGDTNFEVGKSQDVAKPIVANKVTSFDGNSFKDTAKRAFDDELAAAELKAITTNGRKKLIAELQILELQKAQELSNKELTENQIALIEEKYRQKARAATLESFSRRAEAILDFAVQLSNLGNSLDRVLSAGAERELARDKRNNDAKAAGYKKLLDNKLISERRYNTLVAKQDEELAKKKHALDVKAFKRQQALAITGAIINGAMGVTSTLAARPGLADIFSLGVARAIQVGLVVASTALQIAEIKGQKPPEAAKGGVFNGPSHSQGGMTVYDNRTGKPTVEVEGGEPFMVLSKNTMKNNAPIVKALLDSSMNKNGAVVPLVPKWKTAKFPEINTARVLPILASGGVVVPMKSSKAINSEDNGLSDPETKAILRNIVDEQVQTRAALNSFNGRLNAVVSLKDLTDKQALLNKARGASGIN